MWAMKVKHCYFFRAFLPLLVCSMSQVTTEARSVLRRPLRGEFIQWQDPCFAVNARPVTPWRRLLARSPPEFVVLIPHAGKHVMESSVDKDDLDLPKILGIFDVAFFHASHMAGARFARYSDEPKRM